MAAINSITCHPSGNFLLSTSNDSSLKIWDLCEGQLFYTLHGHQGAATSGRFSPTGEFFASGGADEQVLVWKTNFDKKAEKTSEKNASSKRRPNVAAAGEPKTKPKSKTSSQPKAIANPLPEKEAHQEKVVRAEDSSSHQVTEAVEVAQAGSMYSNEVQDALANTLSHIVSQLDVLAQTMALMEERMTITEDRVKKIEQGGRP